MAAAPVLSADDAADRVQNGIQMLNDADVDFDGISKRTLDIADFSKCVGGQLDGQSKNGFNLFESVLDCDAAKGVQGGFDLAHNEATSENYETLTKAWKKAL
jgi:hypothetical protein